MRSTVVQYYGDTRAYRCIATLLRARIVSTRQVVVLHASFGASCADSAVLVRISSRVLLVWVLGTCWFRYFRRTHCEVYYTRQLHVPGCFCVCCQSVDICPLIQKTSQKNLAPSSGISAVHGCLQAQAPPMSNNPCRLWTGHNSLVSPPRSPV